MDTGNNLAWLKAQAVNLLFLTIVLALVVVGTQTVRESLRKADMRLEEIAVETHDSLCAFKQDLTRRYESGVDYIEDVKAGRRQILEGFTIPELERSVQAQKSTLNALTPLTCAS